MAKSSSGKRTNDQIAKDRKIISELYLRGMSQSTIAIDMRLSEATVSRDIAAIRKSWLKETVVNYNEFIAKELARIDQVEREAWDAWERSKTESEEVTRYGFEGKNSGVNMKRAKRDGDPRFLAQVEWCIQQRIKLIGLLQDKPESITRVDVDGITSTERDKRIITLLDAARTRRIGGTT